MITELISTNGQIFASFLQDEIITFDLDIRVLVIERHLIVLINLDRSIWLKKQN